MPSYALATTQYNRFVEEGRQDKADGKYKHFGWGMVKHEYNPKAFNIVSANIKDNPDLSEYIIYIKLK